jgi:phosphatidylglycerophosphate synthase
MTAVIRALPGTVSLLAEPAAPVQVSAPMGGAMGSPIAGIGAAEAYGWVNTSLVAGDGDPSWEIAGLSLGERTRRALAAVGLSAGQGGAANGARLLVSGDALLEPAAIRALMARPRGHDGAVAHLNWQGGLAALRVPAGTPVPTDAGGLRRLAERFRSTHSLRVVDPGDSRCERIRSVEDAERVHAEMLASLPQPTDGFFARYFDRHLSIRLSIELVRRGVAPNVITAVATAVGLLGAALLASSLHGIQVLGALLFVLSTILDGCDGEVARLSLRMTELGRKLDLIGDNLVHVAVFIAIGHLALRADPSLPMQLAVGATLFGVLAALVVAFWYMGWLQRSGRPAAILHRYEALLSRDWAYLVLVLALFGQLPLLIWGAALGSNAVAVALLGLRLKEWPPLSPR